MMIVLALAAALLVPAAAASAKTTYYLALGDSLGYGYQEDAAGHAIQTPNSYVQQVYKAARKRHKGLKLVNYSCPGEKTGTFMSGTCPYAAQFKLPATSQQSRAVAFLKAHRKATTYITISIGANEFTSCSTAGSVDVTCALNGLSTLQANEPRLLKTLRKAAGRKVKIAINNLYNPYLALYLQGGSYADIALGSNQLIGGINNTIADAARGAKVRLADVAAIFRPTDLDTMVTFNGSRVPLAVANTCKYLQMCLPAPQGNIHPNDAGYTVMAKAFKKALRIR